MTHSVEGHLSLQVAEYDRLIRLWIPGYETMLSTLGRWLERLVPARAHIVDLGGGTGALTETLAQALPQATFELWDIDPKMLEAARGRLSAHGDRIRFVERSFHESLPACDAVVASLSLHHIPSPEAKRQVYSEIFRALRRPGAFLNADATMSTDATVRERTYEDWARFMAGHGIAEADARRHFATWAKEDFYRTLLEELELLRAAGFPSPECLWKDGPMGVYGATKDSP